MIYTKEQARYWFHFRLVWVRNARDLLQLERVVEAGRNDLDVLIECELITAAEKDRLARLLRNAADYRRAEEYREVAA
jgi:hypothetical protein